MGSLIFTGTPLNGLFVAQARSFVDERGRFQRIFCNEEFESVHPSLQWRQVNLSYTIGRGSIRGMHFQYPPRAEAKLITCLRGRVFDVAVDVRRASPTFLHWHGIELTAGSGTMLFIPEGFAHGFQVLEDEAELLYMHSASFSPDHDGRLRFDEQRVGIPWPLPIGTVSDRDLSIPSLENDFLGVEA